MGALLRTAAALLAAAARAEAATVIAEFDNGVVSGSVSFTDSCDAAGGVDIVLALRHNSSASLVTTGHLWHIHEHVAPPTASENSMRQCIWAGGHWDPDGLERAANYSCSHAPVVGRADAAQAAAELEGCYRGDMSGKLAVASLGGGVAQTFSDPTLRTTELLGRSLVIHAADGAAQRLACASLLPASSHFPAADIALVQRFYAAIDAKDFAELRALTAVDYEAVFAPGCAAVGGAFHEDEEVLGFASLQALLEQYPAASGSTARTMSSAGEGVVINHYASAEPSWEGVRVHGAAVHRTRNGEVASSFWYGGSEECVRALPWPRCPPRLIVGLCAAPVQEGRRL